MTSREEQIRTLIQRIINSLVSQGKSVELLTILRTAVQHDPELKKDRKILVKIAKEEIERANEMMSLEETEEGSEEDESEGPNEYERLIELFKLKLQDDTEIMNNLVSFLIYGSYAQGKAIIGESNINFLLVLKDNYHPPPSKINQMLESLRKPETEHILDLMVLNKTTVMKSANGGGVQFSAIHALSAKHGIILLGTNILEKVTITSEAIKKSSQLLIKKSLRESKEILEAFNDKEITSEDAAYFLSNAVIDVTLSLLYYYAEKPETIIMTKSEAYELYSSIVGKKHPSLQAFSDFIDDAHALRIGVVRHPHKWYLTRASEFFDTVANVLGF